MVDIFIKKNNRKVSYLRARGHAGYDAYGKDIVCSAISSIITGGFNALTDLDKYDISLNSGEALFLSKYECSSHDSIVLETIITQLKTIENSYPKHLKILILEN